MFVISSCSEVDEPIKKEDENQCEVHQEQLKTVSGYLPNSTTMISPEYGYLEFRIQFGHLYPHCKHPYLSSERSDESSVATTIEFCEECERRFSCDFTSYLMLDEKVRLEQFNQFLKNNPEQEVSESTSEMDALLTDPILPPM